MKTATVFASLLLIVALLSGPFALAEEAAQAGSFKGGRSRPSGFKILSCGLC